MKYLNVSFYSHTFLQRQNYLMSEEEFKLNFFAARDNFLKEYGEHDDVDINISYSDVVRWEN